MEIESLKVPDAWVCTPIVRGDDRGAFLEWFRGDLLAAATGRRFDIVQANHSVSKRGAVRGVHFAMCRPARRSSSTARKAHSSTSSSTCGSARPRSASSTRLFSTTSSGARSSSAKASATLLCALSDDSSANYLVSTGYDPAPSTPCHRSTRRSRCRCRTDIGDWLMSDKDLAAPTLDEALEQGILPTYEACRARYAALA